ncbi:hypothetical protein OOU_Y34scaffold00542g60 [Pyricularia oryzae Y34]|uniref:Uncharacterized protein n=3 Tax=Pyricularia oryzae TaxID=318829 RepID=A0A4P7NET6_PYROR|nr:hypothetical protein OOU_Y34scaffold00542g60 [Pyricularia oryzae Y34]QBZ60379.1 hypothetical protein PoMZ_07320 [Pyricularia oryzae]
MSASTDDTKSDGIQVQIHQGVEQNRNGTKGPMSGETKTGQNDN